MDPIGIGVIVGVITFVVTTFIDWLIYRTKLQREITQAEDRGYTAGTIEGASKVKPQIIKEERAALAHTLRNVADEIEGQSEL